ncbi:hypothetical protein L593_14330 [Salinarchaeum sp. Harcht-Bsk1]|uniref:hypothetical protein n=1 Tax=Salinarchaeum sp. Harcht-Bsk1 TaxID=1333523 RepID=UPI0003422C81|nr:hypothetical protein [Salinarchaeum sp. Harcht-Bsk1]AGN02805.1 hypothetical protein L593_14330 [Salinarchaeum sp. Harcht-Bsk1]
MYGVVTRNEPETEWAEFDHAFYEVKDVTGRGAEPIESAVNMVSCFGDTAAVEAEPDLAAVDADGTPATRDQQYFDWSYVCPTREDYRAGVLATIEDCVAVQPDVRLDDVGFPRAGYCRCETCRDQFAQSDHDEWQDWRAAVISDFVADAVDRIPGRTYLTLYPDPYPGHLFERSGIDVEALEPLVDEFVVPLYDTAYGTTYWLEAIANGFADRISDADLAIELYAVDVEIDPLIHATEVAQAAADAVYFGYDASNARAAIRRLEADARDGVAHGENAGQ